MLPNAFPALLFVKNLCVADKIGYLLRSNSWFQHCASLEKGKSTINLYKAGNRRLSLAVVGGIREIYKQIIPILFCFSIFMTNVTVPHKNSQPYKHCPMLTLSDKEQ